MPPSSGFYYRCTLRPLHPNAAHSRWCRSFQPLYDAQPPPPLNSMTERTAQAGWMRHNQHLPGCVWQPEREREREWVREGGSSCMPASYPCCSRAACDRVEENPPSANYTPAMCQLGYVALCITHWGKRTAAPPHCTPIEIQSFSFPSPSYTVSNTGVWVTREIELDIPLTSHVTVSAQATSTHTYWLCACACVCLCVCFQGWFASLSAFMGLPHWWWLDHGWRMPNTRARAHTRTQWAGEVNIMPTGITVRGDHIKEACSCRRLHVAWMVMRSQNLLDIEEPTWVENLYLHGYINSYYINFTFLSMNIFPAVLKPHCRVMYSLLKTAITKGIAFGCRAAPPAGSKMQSYLPAAPTGRKSLDPKI